jgi:hypothetical protein
MVGGAVMGILDGPKPVSFCRDGAELFRITYPSRDDRPKAGDVVTYLNDGSEWRVKSMIASGLGVIATAEVEPVVAGENDGR